MAVIFNISALVGAIGTLTAARVGIMTWSLTSRLDRWRDRKERRRAARAKVRRRAQGALDVVVAIHSEILFRQRRQQRAPDPRRRQARPQRGNAARHR